MHFISEICLNIEEINVWYVVNIQNQFQMEQVSLEDVTSLYFSVRRFGLLPITGCRNFGDEWEDTELGILSVEIYMLYADQGGNKKLSYRFNLCPDWTHAARRVCNSDKNYGGDCRC